MRLHRDCAHYSESCHPMYPAASCPNWTPIPQSHDAAIIDAAKAHVDNPTDETFEALKNSVTATTAKKDKAQIVTTNTV